MIPLKLKLGVAGGVIILSVISIVRSTKPALPPLDRDLHSILGGAMAGEVANRLGENKSIVVILPEAPFKVPLVESQYRAFKKALSDAGGGKIVAEEKIRLEQMGSLDGLLTPAFFFEIAARHSAAGALVSFVGLGDFSREDLARASQGTPALYEISPNVAVPQALLDKRLVRVAIVPRWDVDPAAIGIAATDQERFNRQFEVITAPEGGR